MVCWLHLKVKTDLDTGQCVKMSDEGTRVRDTLRDVTRSSQFTTAPTLPSGYAYHVQFICDRRDLHVIEETTVTLTQAGYKCVDLLSYPYGGREDIRLIEKFTSTSLWNIVVVSKNIIDSKLFEFQHYLAEHIAIIQNKRNIVILQAQKNMENFLSLSLSSFEKITLSEDGMWLLNLTSVISHQPSAFGETRNKCSDENHEIYNQLCRTDSRDKLCQSDDIIRVKRFAEVKRPKVTSVFRLYRRRHKIKWPRI